MLTIQPERVNDVRAIKWRSTCYDLLPTASVFVVFVKTRKAFRKQCDLLTTWRKICLRLKLHVYLNEIIPSTDSFKWLTNEIAYFVLNLLSLTSFQLYVLLARISAIRATSYPNHVFSDITGTYQLFATNFFAWSRQTTFYSTERTWLHLKTRLSTMYIIFNIVWYFVMFLWTWPPVEDKRLN